MAQIETELQLLKTEAVNMWTLVNSQLSKARQAFLTFDKDLAREVVLKEKRVNGTVLKINSNLERIGDIAEGIAKYIIDAEVPFTKELLEVTRVLPMYEEAVNMLEDTRAAFEKEDTILA